MTNAGDFHTIRLTIICMGFMLLVLPPAYADTSSSMYKDHAYSTKDSYYILVDTAARGLANAEKLLNAVFFDSPNAQKLMDTAWELRGLSHELHKNSVLKVERAEKHLKLHEYERAHYNLVSVREDVMLLKNNLAVITVEVSKARAVEKEYQRSSVSCFAFWCSDLKTTFDIDEHLFYHLQNNIIEIDEILNLIDQSNRDFDKSLYEYELKNKEYQISQLTEKHSEQKQLIQSYEQEIVVLSDTREQYASELQDQKELHLETLARDHPHIQQIISGQISFYVNPLPNFIDDDVSEFLDIVFETIDETEGFTRVYSEGESDLHFQFIRDFTPEILGQNFNTLNQVGLGSSNCMGDWRPFDPGTVYQILWHEFGHSLGYLHSSDPQNIMYPTLETSFISDYEGTEFLAEGAAITIPFCGSGDYYYEISSDDEYNGFQVSVLDGDSTIDDFFDGEFYHYPECGSNDENMYLFSKQCTLPSDSKLLIYNPYDFNSGAINVDVKIVDSDVVPLLDLDFSKSELLYSDELLEYVENFEFDP